jgi:Mg2+ and Co2+ transporter CorA
LPALCQNGTKLADIPVSEISDSISRPDAFVWVAMQNASPSELGEMRRERCEREPELLRHGSGFVLYALMDAVVDRYFPILDGLDTELETIEKDIFTKGTARFNIERLYELKGRVMILKHAVAPQMEGASKLHGGRVPTIQHRHCHSGKPSDGDD